MRPSAISARSEFVSDHPLRLAQEIAKLLDSDPIAAGQVKEHLSEERLIELLELDPPRPEPETFADMVDESPFDDDDALEFVKKRFSLEGLLKGFTKTELLEAANGL